MPHEHDAQHAGELDGNCAACVWQVNSTTDVPVVTVPVVAQHTVILARTPAVVSLPVEFVFFAPVAGRAPPETTA
jgi:hypothetical protein